jgi:hypothetical protein
VQALEVVAERALSLVLAETCRPGDHLQALQDLAAALLDLQTCSEPSVRLLSDARFAHDGGVYCGND